MDQEILDYPLRIVSLPLLVGTDGSIFLVFFINSMQQQTTGQFLPYVTSAFSLHSLIPVIGIVSNITTGVMKPPLAKILDVFGRFEGLAISLLFSVIGLILMASCTSVHIGLGTSDRTGSVQNLQFVCSS